MSMLPSLLSFKTCKRLKRTLILFKQYRKIIIMQVLNAGTFFMLQTNYHFHLVSLAMQTAFSSDKKSFIVILFHWPCEHLFQVTNNHFHLVSLAMQAHFSSNKQIIIFILFRWPCRHLFQAANHQFHHYHFHLVSLAMQAPFSSNKPSFSSPSFSSCFVGHAGTFFKQQTNHHFHHHHFHLVSLAMQAPFSSNKQTIIFITIIFILFCWPGMVVVIKRVLCMCVLFFLARSCNNGFAVNRRF